MVCNVSFFALLNREAVGRKRERAGARRTMLEVVKKYLMVLEFTLYCVLLSIVLVNVGFLINVLRPSEPRKRFGEGANAP